MPADLPLVILLDLDNTLLDSDGIKADFDRYLGEAVGEALRVRFWELYEQVRRELGMVSFPVALERLHQEAPGAHACSHGIDYLARYPFRRRLLPGALAAIRSLRRWGTAVVLSDGDPWFQFKKVTESGIARAVDGNVLIFTHKEQHLEEVRSRFPAAHYACFDDKPELLARIKEQWGDGVSTVWLAQGGYARRGWDGIVPGADLVLTNIGQARWLTDAQLRGAAPGPVRRPSPARVPAAPPAPPRGR